MSLHVLGCTDRILNLSKKSAPDQSVCSCSKKKRRRKKRSILFSLWAIASMAVNRVTVRSRYNYKRCLHIAATHLLLKSWCWEVYGARLEKGATCPGRARKVKLSIWLTLSPQQAHGTALGQALGAAAASADRAQPPCGSVQKHCSLLTVTHRHTRKHALTRQLFTGRRYMEACEWSCSSLRFKKKKHWNHEGFLNLILSCSCQTLVLHNYNYYGIRQQPCTVAALKWTENGQTQFPSNDSRHIRVLPFS